MMQEICVLKLTAGHIQRVYERVIGEPGIAGAAVPDLEVEATGEVLALRIFPNDLEDILANLLRNALAAGASWIGVRLGGSADPITGVEYVELAICDDAPGILTNQLLRRRHIGRGLGLAVDLVNRHEGEIRVEPGKKAGEKAVVVCFPRVEVEL
jgi:signal transduction histidine kinase